MRSAMTSPRACSSGCSCVLGSHLIQPQRRRARRVGREPHEVVAKHGLLYTEHTALSYILCRPRLMELGPGASRARGGSRARHESESERVREESSSA